MWYHRLRTSAVDYGSDAQTREAVITPGTWRPRWANGKVSALQPEGSRLETRFHRRSVVFWASCTLNLTSCVKRPPSGVVRKSGEGKPAQVSSSSSDCGSKL
ncbi:hypothetical protein AVEN_101455-1 [Araneus ventricosus]|uniref:Uncharacterized protein n=1 Tax=Araneus ventricosus TaxID=182803 RepID=A0A4Y2CV30_ARAVE|nr:hypothetical protein AVEN_101455-1 [Araneus ventricosus]